MVLNVSHVSEYLRLYALQYRRCFEEFTAAPPQGAGYPAIVTSSFLDSPRIDCYIAVDGVVVADMTGRGQDHWAKGHPCAVLVIMAPNLQPNNKVLEVPHWKISCRDQIPDAILKGCMGNPIEVASCDAAPTRIVVNQVDVPLKDVVSRLTLGGIGECVKLPIPDEQSPFWRPWSLRHIGFVLSDGTAQRYLRQIDMYPHLDLAAWDVRSIPVRVECDIRRDYSVAISGPPGGSLFLPPEVHSRQETFFDRLVALRAAIDKLKKALEETSDASESVFHEILTDSPLLLDVYGEVESKPRFRYPEDNAGPTGKSYVEPDFLIRLPGRRYRLVEIERPSKRIATRQGQPNAEFTQATFQTAEWVDYIKNHYDLLRDKYPGISSNYETAVVISRTDARSYGDRIDPDRYKDLIRNQFAFNDFLTYDDVLQRAESAYVRLSVLQV